MGKRSRARSRKRKNPQLITINPSRRRRAKKARNPLQDALAGLLENPSPTRCAEALARYRQFHGVNPTRATRLGKGSGVLIALGELREIVYQPRRGHRKGPAFFHQFKPGSVLATNPAGTKLVIVDRRKRTAVDFDLGIVN